MEPDRMDERKIQDIIKLKKEKNALILVHNYQIPEVQDIADFLGDSLDLSRKARDTDKDVIVFCGVRFMAETAKILSPAKKVLLPSYQAGCPMADMVTSEALRDFKAREPGWKIVCYVNTSADVKAECDLCVTSANAVRVIRNYPYDRFLFVPDKNLGSYVKDQVKEKEIRLWDGYCHVHARLALDEVKKAKKIRPEAQLLVHPECEPGIVQMADEVLSTNQMLKFVRESKAKEFLIATEEGILYRMQKENPDKLFFPASRSLICPNMKQTRLSDVLNSLRYDQYEISLTEEIIRKAGIPLDEMLKYS
ncbi:MAG: quinolinate synthase NadA [bacterium]|nr:quinolinate synthase NadA [bacterium]